MKMKHITSLFLFLCLLAAAGVRAQDTTPDRQYKHDAMRLWAEGTYKGYLKSVPLLSKAVGSDPSDEDALWKLMKAYSVTYRMREAVETAKTGRERFSKNGDWGAVLYFLLLEERYDEIGEGNRKELINLVEQTLEVYEEALEDSFSPWTLLHYLLLRTVHDTNSEKIKAILDKYKEQLKFSDSMGEDLYYDIIRSRLEERGFRKEMKRQLHIDFAH